MKRNEDLVIIKKKMMNPDSNFFLKLNRDESLLEVYQRVDNETLNEYHSIRADFDSYAYAMYEKTKSFDCIFGGENSPTPTGVFNIESKSKGEYISEYYEKYDRVKFFGYLVVFEDYFIHSDLYRMEVSEQDIRGPDKPEPVSKGDNATSGCIRVSQEDLDWLLDEVEAGSVVVM